MALSDTMPMKLMDYDADADEADVDARPILRALG